MKGQKTKGDEIKSENKQKIQMLHAKKDLNVIPLSSMGNAAN